MFSSLTVNNILLDSRGETLSDLFFPWFLQIWKKSTDWKNSTDDQCVQGIAGGEESPFQVLFDRYGDLVFGYCLKILGDCNQAEDASQDVWMRVIKAAGKFQARGQCKAWILQIARNVCISIFRDQKKRFYEELPEDGMEDVSRKDILDLIGDQQTQLRMKASIERLPEQQRAALVIWMTEEKSYEELARDLKTTVSGIKSLLFRSKQNLKKMMGAQGE